MKKQHHITDIREERSSISNDMTILCPVSWEIVQDVILHGLPKFMGSRIKAEVDHKGDLDIYTLKTRKLGDLFTVSLRKVSDHQTEITCNEALQGGIEQDRLQRDVRRDIELLKQAYPELSNHPIMDFASQVYKKLAIQMEAMLQGKEDIAQGVFHALMTSIHFFATTAESKVPSNLIAEFNLYEAEKAQKKTPTPTLKAIADRVGLSLPHVKRLKRDYDQLRGQPERRQIKS